MDSQIQNHQNNSHPLSHNPSNSADSSGKISLNEVQGKKKSKKKIWIISLLILLLISTIGGGSYYYFAVYKKPANQNTNSSNLITEIFQTPTEEPTPTPTPEPIFYPNPITGEMMPEADYLAIKDRPFMAVMIQNNISSRPEYGLNEADIVYEALVESRITRFMAVYWSKDAAKVQSLRSARKYYVDLLGDYTNPVYMHIGYSTGDVKVDALQAMNKYGTQRIGDLRDANTKELAYSRDSACEKVKAREHCAYTTTQRLWAISEQKGWKNDLSKNISWKFSDSDKIDLTSGTALSDFTVHFKPAPTLPNYFDTNYTVNWKYDPITNKYLRFNANGTPYLDGNGVQVTSSTVIYQKILSTPTGDAKSHQLQEVIGSGTGFVMMQGKVFKVNWSKPNYATKTKFTDATTGAEFVFQRGKIWNMLMPKTFDYIANK